MGASRASQSRSMPSHPWTMGVTSFSQSRSMCEFPNASSSYTVSPAIPWCLRNTLSKVRLIGDAGVGGRDSSAHDGEYGPTKLKVETGDEAQMAGLAGMLSVLVITFFVTTIAESVVWVVTLDVLEVTRRCMCERGLND